MTSGRHPSPICQAAAGIGGSGTGSCFATAPCRSANRKAPPIAIRIPGSLSVAGGDAVAAHRCASQSPERQHQRDHAATASAARRESATPAPPPTPAWCRRSRRLRWREATAARAPSGSSTELILSTAAAGSSRPHWARGTRRLCPPTTAMISSSIPPTTPEGPRADSGGNSLSRCFITGQLRPQLTEVMSEEHQVRSSRSSRGRRFLWSPS